LLGRSRILAINYKFGADVRNPLAKVPRYFYIWVFSVFIFSLPILTSYVFVQQEARSAIEVPLIQMAQSAKADLQTGVGPATILKAQSIDLSVSQMPFITLYSLDKKVIGSSETLKGKTLLLPNGVLDNARAKGETRVTWQPKSGLRFASITEYVPTFGYIAVAESLREVETRATRNTWLALVALGMGSVTSGLGIYWFSRLRRRGLA
jgi:hypothetical protein